MNLVEVLGLIATIISISSFIYYLIRRKTPTKIKWREAEKAATIIVDKMITNNYKPTLIFGIGRGGAIFGSLISGSFGHIPLLVVDRNYKWSENGRTEELNLQLNLPITFLHKVLLVAGESHSGSTMRCFVNYLEKIKATSIKKAVLFLEDDCPIKIDYFGLRSANNKILMPWMSSSRYLRSDRVSTLSIRPKDNYKITVFFVRHAQTYSGEDIFTGRNDYGLSIKGITEALECGHSFISHNIKNIYSSPLGRAMKTAKIINDFIPEANFNENEKLQEINYGDWEGLSRKNIKKTFPKLYASWENDPISNIPPNSETPEQTLNRIKFFLEMIVDNFFGSENVEIIAVSHKTLIRILHTFLLNDSLSNYRKYNISNCQRTKIQYDGKKWILSDEN